MARRKKKKPKAEISRPDRTLEAGEYPKGQVAHTRGWEPGDPLDVPATRILVNGIEQSQEERERTRKGLEALHSLVPPPEQPKQLGQLLADMREHVDRQLEGVVNSEVAGNAFEQSSKPKPPKTEKPVDLSDLVERLEAAEKENPPTAEELAKRKKRLEDLAASLGLLDVRPPDFSSLVDSLQREEEKRLANMAKPSEWPAFDTNDYPPSLVEFSRSQNERREADAEANAHAIEQAIDNALKRAEERERIQQELAEMGTRRGFPPINGASKKEVTPHWFETGIGDARLWGVIAVIGLAIAFSRRSAHSDLAVWFCLVGAAILGVLIVNTHRSIRTSSYRRWATVLVIMIAVPFVVITGKWLTIPDVPDLTSEQIQRLTTLRTHARDLSDEAMSFLTQRDRARPKLSPEKQDEEFYRRQHDFDEETVELFTERYGERISELVAEAHSNKIEVGAMLSFMARHNRPVNELEVRDTISELAELVGRIPN